VAFLTFASAPENSMQHGCDTKFAFCFAPGFAKLGRRPVTAHRAAQRKVELCFLVSIAVFDRMAKDSIGKQTLRKCDIRTDLSP
jgi:hypothetical protein